MKIYRGNIQFNQFNRIVEYFFTKSCELPRVLLYYICKSVASMQSELIHICMYLFIKRNGIKQIVFGHLKTVLGHFFTILLKLFDFIVFFLKKKLWKYENVQNVCV